MKAIDRIPIRPLYLSLRKPEFIEPGTLVLLRHGQSKYNEDGKWAGWVDINLTDAGISQAKQAGKILRQSEFRPTHIYTTRLCRAYNTAQISLHSMGLRLSDVDIKISDAIIERHCGALTGISKDEVLKMYGEEVYNRCRRSYTHRPPAMHSDHPCHPGNKTPGDKVIGLPNNKLGAESIEDVDKRVAPFWESELLPQLKAGNNVLVVAHTHSIRTLERNILALTPEQLENGPEVHNATPVFYRFMDNQWKVKDKECLGAPIKM